MAFIRTNKRLKLLKAFSSRRACERHVCVLRILWEVDPQVKFDQTRENPAHWEGVQGAVSTLQWRLQEHGLSWQAHERCARHLSEQAMTELFLLGRTAGTHLTCPHCEKSVHKASINRHIKTQHQNQESVACEHCNGVYKNIDSLKFHLRSAHGIYQRWIRLLQAKSTAAIVTSISVLPSSRGMCKMCIPPTMKLSAPCATKCSRTQTHTSITSGTRMAFTRANKCYPNDDSLLF